MSERFYISLNTIDIPDETPLLFLEGPVQGAPDWQTPLAHILLGERPDIVVASPRPTVEHENALKSLDPAEAEPAADRQVAWEFLARNLAMDSGGAVMWWEPQDPTISYNPKRVYGKTSNIETGEIWGWKRAHPDFPFALGYDPDFVASGANSKNYILRNHNLMGYPVFGSIEAIAEAILKQLPHGIKRSTPPSAFQSIQRAMDQLRSA